MRKSFVSKINKSKIYRHKYWLIAGLLILILITGFYLNRSEDLGEQLPPPPADALYKQASQPDEKRVNDLLARMTLEEKIGQMALVDKNSLGKIEDISKYYLGGILSGAGAKPEINTPQGWMDMITEMKQQASKSRLGIPILYGVDANHGHSNVLGATVFPHAIGLGASGDAKLVEQVASITSDELSATGINWSYSPSLDAPKDMRWGRVYEAFSDSPELISELGSAYIKGTQQQRTDDTYVLASAKHFLATGAMEWNQSNHKKFKIDQGKTTASEIALKNEYLSPYKSAVDAGVSSVMVGLNQWGDQRIIESKYLITDKLKNELGFEGFVVSDWYGVYEYSRTSKYDANVKTINAGLDIAMLPYDYKDFMNDVRKAVNNGEISQERIDDAVSRILYQKFKAGLFDVKSGNIDKVIVGSEKNRQVAREAVASSAVLLKNNDSFLPLSKGVGQILIAGSGADNVGRQSGAWTIEWQGVDGNWMPGGTSILQGIREVVGDNSMIDYEKDGMFDYDSTKADVGIAIVSEKPYAEGWGDNANPTIGADDLAVIERLKKSSKKIVVIILSGRPLIITDQLPTWDVVVAGWLPGSEGAGIADVLFGNHPFTAKLPLPWPASIEQLPISTDGKTNNNTGVLFDRFFGLKKICPNKKLPRPGSFLYFRVSCLDCS